MTSACIETPEGNFNAEQLWEMLQQERFEADEEASQMRDKLKKIQHNLKQEHEEELAELLAENERLHAQLSEVQKNGKPFAKYDANTQSDNGVASDKDIVLKDCETYKEQIKVLTVTLQKERDENIKTKIDLVQQNVEVSKLRHALEEAQLEASSFKNRFENSEAELHETRQREKELSNKLKSALLTRQTSQQSFEDEVETLRAENKRLRMAQSKHANDDARIAELEKECLRLQQQLDDIKPLESKYNENVKKLTTALHENVQLQRQIDEYSQDLNEKSSELTNCQLSIATLKLHYEGIIEDMKKKMDLLMSKNIADTRTDTRADSTQIMQVNLEILSLENGALKEMITSFEQDIENLKHQLSQAKREEEKKQRQLEDATSRQQMIELNHDKFRLETQSEMEKLQEKHAALEALNEDLREELERKTANSRVNEVAHTLKLQQQAAELQVSKEELISSRQQVIELQGELTRVSADGDRTARDLSMTREELEASRREVEELRKQLQQLKTEKLQNRLENDNLNHQLSLCKDREASLEQKNSELRKTITDVQGTLAVLQQTSKSTSDKRLQAEQNQQTMQYEIERQKVEINNLKQKINETETKYISSKQKLEDLKMKHKEKLQEQQEEFDSEKKKIINEKHKLFEELDTMKKSLNKQTQLREQQEETARRIAADKKELMTKLTDLEGSNQDSSQVLAVLKIREKFLEDENNTLMERIASLTRQKHNLERLVKEYEIDSEKQLYQQFSPQISPRTVTSHSPRTKLTYSPTEINNNIMNIDQTLTPVSSAHKNNNNMGVNNNTSVKNNTNFNHFENLQLTVPNNEEKYEYMANKDTDKDSKKNENKLQHQKNEKVLDDDLSRHPNISANDSSQNPIISANDPIESSNDSVLSYPSLPNSQSKIADVSASSNHSVNINKSKLNNNSVPLASLVNIDQSKNTNNSLISNHIGIKDQSKLENWSLQSDHSENSDNLIHCEHSIKSHPFEQEDHSTQFHHLKQEDHLKEAHYSQQEDHSLHEDSIVHNDQLENESELTDDDKTEQDSSIAEQSEDDNYDEEDGKSDLDDSLAKSDENEINESVLEEGHQRVDFLNDFPDNESEDSIIDV